MLLQYPRNIHTPQHTSSARCQSSSNCDSCVRDNCSFSRSAAQLCAMGASAASPTRQRQLERRGHLNARGGAGAGVTRMSQHWRTSGAHPKHARLPTTAAQTPGCVCVLAQARKFICCVYIHGEVVRMCTERSIHDPIVVDRHASRPPTTPHNQSHDHNHNASTTTGNNSNNSNNSCKRSTTQALRRSPTRHRHHDELTQDQLR